MNLPELKITVYSDYICPFCYLGHHRLFRLRDSYDLKVNWCFLEIHPETASDGDTINSLDYSSEQWQKMITNMNRIAAEDGIPFAHPGIIANSKNSLLLAEAAKQCSREAFYKFHEAVFHSYFVDNKNISDKTILTNIAESCGINKKTIESAWLDQKHQKRLQDNFISARKHSVQSVPSFVFGDQVLTGVVTEANFRKAAELVTGSN